MSTAGIAWRWRERERERRSGIALGWFRSGERWPNVLADTSDSGRWVGFAQETERASKTACGIRRLSSGASFFPFFLCSTLKCREKGVQGRSPGTQGCVKTGCTSPACCMPSPGQQGRANASPRTPPPPGSCFWQDEKWRAAGSVALRIFLINSSVLHSTLVTHNLKAKSPGAKCKQQGRVITKRYSVEGPPAKLLGSQAFPPPQHVAVLPSPLEHTQCSWGYFEGGLLPV